jgi:hypothetical protein
VRPFLLPYVPVCECAPIVFMPVHLCVSVSVRLCVCLCVRASVQGPRRDNFWRINCLRESLRRLTCDSNHPSHTYIGKAVGLCWLIEGFIYFAHTLLTSAVVHVSLCVCVYVLLCNCVCVSVCLCLCICASVYLCVCTFMYLCVCVSVHLCICVSVYLCVCASVRLYICASCVCASVRL